MRIVHFVLLLTTVVITSIEPRLGLADTYTAMILQPPSGSAFNYVKGWGASSDSSVGSGAASAVSSVHALLWNADGVTDLHPTGFTDSEAYSVSGKNQVGYGVGSSTGFQLHALLWNGAADTGMDLHPSGYSYSYALKANGSSQVGAAATLSGDEHAILWNGTAASAVDLHPVGFNSSSSTGLFGNAQVGSGSGMATGNREHALLWNGNASSVVDLNPTGYATSTAYANYDNTQVGSGTLTGTSEIFTRALLWNGTAASYVDLHPTGFISSEAFGANQTKQVGVADDHAVVWNGSANDFVDLHSLIPGTWDISYAESIAENGDIVGWAGNLAGTNAVAVRWSAVAVPEPMSLAMLGSIAFVAVGARLARRRNVSPIV